MTSPHPITPSAEAGTVTLRHGAVLPLLGFGTWQLRGGEAYDAVRAALDLGYRHLDTATMYRNEHEVGRALRDSGLSRDEVFLTTKLPPDRAERARETLEESLRALTTDYVDLWLIHWPPDEAASPEIWTELLRARSDDLARAVGVSNYSTPQVDELTEAAGEAPEVNQIPWGPALYDPRRVAELRDRSVVLEGYSPFRSGNLAEPTLTEIAAAYGVSVPQVIVRWHLQHEVVVIPKSARRDRIAANADVFGFALTEDDMARIDALGVAAAG